MLKMWKSDQKGGWALKNWCFCAVVLEKTLESPLDCKDIKSVYPKRNQSWTFVGSTDAEAETPILWPADVNSWLIRKDSDGNDWGQEGKGITEDEMVGWHHWLDGHKFEQALGDGGQGNLVCCSPWGHKDPMTPWLSNRTITKPHWRLKLNPEADLYLRFGDYRFLDSFNGNFG